MPHSCAGCCQLGGGAFLYTPTLFQRQWPEGSLALSPAVPQAGTGSHSLCQCEEPANWICFECVTMSLDTVSLLGTWQLALVSCLGIGRSGGLREGCPGHSPCPPWSVPVSKDSVTDVINLAHFINNKFILKSAAEQPSVSIFVSLLLWHSGCTVRLSFSNDSLIWRRTHWMWRQELWASHQHLHPLVWHQSLELKSCFWPRVMILMVSIFCSAWFIDFWNYRLFQHPDLLHFR